MTSPRHINKLLGGTRFAQFCAITPVLILLAGCGQVNGSTQTQFAQLRVIDTSSSSGGLDVHVGSKVLAYNIGFGSIVNYTAVTPGAYTINANQAGTTTTSVSVRGTLAAATDSTLLIGGGSGSAEAQLLTDQSQPAPGNQSLVRILAQATQVGSVDVYFVPTSGSLVTTRPVATSVNFNDIRTGIAVPTDTYQIVLLPAGTVPVAATATTAATVALYTGAATSFPAGSARTVILLDTQITSTPAVQVIVASDFDSPYTT